MTSAEHAALLRATTAHDSARHHVLYSTAPGTGLRLREFLCLNESPDGREVPRGEVLIPERPIPKLGQFLEQDIAPGSTTRQCIPPPSDRCSEIPVLGVTLMSFITAVQPPCPSG